jgi:hypothetical protein
LIGYALTVGAIFFGTLVPAYLALYLIPQLKVNTWYLAALGVGLSFWFYYDTMGDAAAVGVDSAIYPFSAFGGFPHFGLIAVFCAGVAALAIFDHFAVPKDILSADSSSAGAVAGPALSKSLILIPVGVAAVMGIHGLGEGWDLGSAAFSATGGIVGAFGGWNPVISYPLHKFFEASIIAVVYTSYVGKSNVAQKAAWQRPVLGVLFGMTSVIGASLGYIFTTLDTTYFFAFGVTAAFYAVMRLVEAMNQRFVVGETAPTFLGAKKFLAFAVGFFLLYVAALFH